MYTIKENVENVLEIKKSKFIAKLYKVKSIEEVNLIINELKIKFSDATHVCYAYKIDDMCKFSDDKEPGGTAGLPMMEVINKCELNFILAVVIRYFGGVKLGAGGLVRAYSKCVSQALDKTALNNLVDGFSIQITTSYENSKKLDYITKDIKNITKKYSDNIIYILEVDKEQLKALEEFSPIILNHILIEKN